MSRNIMPWSSTALSVHPDEPEGATNYAAALKTASEVLAQQDGSPNRKLMIFLSDGVPTLAYSDGKLHTSFTEGNVIGSGNDYTLCLYTYINQYFRAAYEECEGTPEIPGNIFSSRDDVKSYVLRNSIDHDDDDNELIGYTRYMWWSDEPELYVDPDDETDYGFPRMFDFTTIDIAAPGISSTWGPFTDGTGEQYAAWYDAYWSIWDDEQKIAWLLENASFGDEYDLFYLTENAFLDFRQACPDVAVYTIGFSANDFNTLPSGRSGDEVLKYMAGDLGNNPSGRYYNCQNEGDLSKVILDIASVSGVSVIDPLSEYVDLSDAPKLEIKMTLGEGAEAVTKTLYGYDEVNDRYDFTADGRYYLDTTATKFDADGTLNVVFKPERRFFERFYCETSFEVRANLHAHNEYLDTGYNATGDDNTDHPGNDTSSLKPGFFSNDKAIAKWTFGVEDQGEFPNPVVQVHTLNVQLKKVDSNDTSVILGGVEFDLYRAVESGTAGSVEIPGAAGHYGVKINESSLVSVQFTPIEIPNLYYGHYYLVETKTLNGYSQPETPVEFDLNNDQIQNVSGDASANGAGPRTLVVKNTCWYELPETGGAGTTLLYTLGGLILVISTAMYGYVLRRKRERRAK